MQQWLVFQMVFMLSVRVRAMSEGCGCSASLKAFFVFYGSSFRFLVRVPSTDGPSLGLFLLATLGSQYFWVLSKTSYTWSLAVSAYIRLSHWAGAMERIHLMKKGKHSSKRILRKEALLLGFKVSVKRC